MNEANSPAMSTLASGAQALLLAGNLLLAINFYQSRAVQAGVAVEAAAT